MTDFDSHLIPPYPPACEHESCQYCLECHINGCLLFQPLCEDAKEEQEKHQQHLEKNIYWGGCRLCNSEREAKEKDLETRKVTYVSFRYSDVIGIVRGIVENAQTQEDLVWVAQIPFLTVKNVPNKLDIAKQIVALNQLAEEAIWLDDDEFQKLVDILPPARQPQSFVDFGDPYEDRMG